MANQDDIAQARSRNVLQQFSGNGINAKPCGVAPALGAASRDIEGDGTLPQCR
jgi:hypothetical protein